MGVELWIGREEGVESDGRVCFGRMIDYKEFRRPQAERSPFRKREIVKRGRKKSKITMLCRRKKSLRLNGEYAHVYLIARDK
jgi:hypothetical protein